MFCSPSSLSTLRFPRNSLLILALLCLVTGVTTCQANAQEDLSGELPSATETVQPDEASQPSDEQRPEFGEAEIVVADQLAGTIRATEWLGPMAPIALSPFFGVTMLSGLSLFAPDWIHNNRFLQSTPALQDQRLFWTFLLLTIATSLPRLTKISKPLAQALDRVETYGTIIILLLIRFFSGEAGDHLRLETPEVVIAGTAVVHAGIVELSANALLSIAMVINILVINGVKFFFEFLIWLTPFPAIDAIFEACNKTLCAALMAIYAFSPTLATILNLCILVVCALALRWIHRRVIFYRTLVLDPILSWLFRARSIPSKPELIIFPRVEWEGFTPLSRLRLLVQDDHWVVEQVRWFLPSKRYMLPCDSHGLHIESGLLSNLLVIKQGNQQIAHFSFSRRYSSQLPQLAAVIRAEFDRGIPVRLDTFEPTATGLNPSS